MEVLKHLTEYFNKIPSGIHLTSNAYVATYLLKDLTATEYKGELDLGNLSKIKYTELKILISFTDLLKVYCYVEYLQGLTTEDLWKIQGTQYK